MQGDHHTQNHRTTSRDDDRQHRRRALGVLRGSVYALTALLGLSLLVMGTIAIIAELKGTWHWSIHLQSTLSYVGLLVQYLLAGLVPLFGLFLVARGRWSDV